MVPCVRNSVARPLPLAKMLDLLRHGRVVVAVEHERVEAGFALDYVTAIAVVPDERVVAGAEERRVGAFAADDRVVAIGRRRGCRCRRRR